MFTGMLSMLFMARKNAPTPATARHFDRRGKALVHSTPSRGTAIWLKYPPLPQLCSLCCVPGAPPKSPLPTPTPFVFNLHLLDKSSISVPTTQLKVVRFYSRTWSPSTQDVIRSFVQRWHVVFSRLWQFAFAF